MNQRIRELLHNKYIGPIDQPRESYVGVEIEMPIVNLAGEATDQKVCQRAFAKAIREFGFLPRKHDEENVCHEAEDPETGDLFSFDCSYNNFEISFGRARDLVTIDQRFRRYISFLNEKLACDHHILTGLGIQPFYKKCTKNYIASGRYKMLEGYLKKSNSWKKEGGFHSYPEYGTFSSSSQLQLDIQKDQLIETIKTFSLLEPIKSLLFANSIMPEDEPDYLCVRDLLWEYSTHGINPRNVGFYEAVPETVEEFLDYISYTSIFCADRGDRYLYFYPVPILEYLEKKEIAAEYYDHGEYRSCTFTPREEDLQFLRTYKFLDLTARGTIEYRSLCTQPLGEVLSGAAFQLGLAVKLPELREIFRKDQVLYRHGFTAGELRKMFNRGHIPEVIDERELRNLVLSITKLAEAGLLERGLGEEKFLQPVFKRAQQLTSPAAQMKKRLDEGEDLTEIICAYAAI